MRRCLSLMATPWHTHSEDSSFITCGQRELSWVGGLELTNRQEEANIAEVNELKFSHG